MFAVRGIAVSFSIFVVIYAVLSVAVLLVWRRSWLSWQKYSASRCADLSFLLRILPFAVAIGITLALAVPSFLLLEPRTGDEPMSVVLMALGCCGVGVTVAGIWKALAALARASRNMARWSSQAMVISAGQTGVKNSVPVLRISGPAPPLTAAGILRPRVWLSRAAEFVLTDRELRTALRHERVHVRRQDNLKKLILRLVAFPGMAELESAWLVATEMAADDEAVSSASEALDLAAAVIKLSRLAPFQPPEELATALVHSPADSLNARVERLIGWEERRSATIGWSSRYVLCASVVALVALAVSYSNLLVRVHAATEWLVR